MAGVEAAGGGREAGSPRPLPGDGEAAIIAQSPPAGTAMSRLESMIRRLEAQVRCLDAAMAAIAGVPGVVLELGLGNGRTFDHLRERLGGREILVFERHLIAHPACVPDDEFLFLGNLEDTLPPLMSRLEGRVVLIHADLGTAAERYPLSLEKLIAATFPRLLRRDGIVLTDKPLANAGLTPMALPEGVASGRYHMYRPEPGPGRGRGKAAPR